MFLRLRERFANVAAAAPRAYWYVWWGTLVNRLGGFVVPLLTFYLINVRKLSVAEAGGIVSIFGAGAVAASIVGGQLSDRLGRRATMAMSLFGGAIAMGILGFVRDLTTLAIMVGVAGFVAELYRPAVLAFIADIVPPAQRVHAYGLLHWVINVGFAVASVVGGLLAELDFTILFLADAATMAIYGTIVLIAVPETRPPRATRDPATPHPRERAWFTDRAFVWLLVLTFGIALLPGQATATLSAHLRWQGFSSAGYGALMAVNGALIIALQPSLAAWSARRDPSSVLVLAALFFGGGIAMHGVASAIWLHAGAVMCWTIGEILESPTRSGVVATLAPAGARGRYQGAVVMTFGAAQLVSPKLGTWLWEHEGPDVLWGGCLALGLVLALGYAVTAPARRRRLASAVVSAPSPSESS
ncbi:MAG: MDR family MFS transporter [Kofleriaceae bacterium]